MLNLTLHGANPENLYKYFNLEIPEKIIDFSSNTNINSWPEIKINLSSLASSYPDIDCLKLVNLISSRENINPNKILFVNGINQAVFLLARLFNNSRTAILQPSYSEYSRAFYNSRDIFSLDEAKKFSQVIIINPNNPTGFFINNLSQAIKNFPGTLFIVDEAYIDFLIYGDRPERLCDFENVIILRSLTKIFHLSGVRIGYVIASEKIINALKKFLPSWSVNSIAQELALYFLNDKDFYEKSRNFYKINTPEFIRDLKNLGLKIINSRVHFFLIQVKNDFELIKFLLNKGLVVRHTRNFKNLPEYNKKFIRVATRRPDENKIFVQAMKDFL